MPSGSRILFLDDSGKPDVNHPSRAVVIGGFAIDVDRYPVFARCINGAKQRSFPGRGPARSFEVKSDALVKPNPWRRRSNRDFCEELARLVGEFGGTTYTCTITKAAMHHPMTLTTTMPLQLQALVEHFGLECRHRGQTGIVVSDWSSHHNDQHASACVATFADSRRIAVHPTVYYASSHYCEGVQVADLIAGVRCRTAEGDPNLMSLNARFAAIREGTPLGDTARGRPFNNAIELF